MRPQKLGRFSLGQIELRNLFEPRISSVTKFVDRESRICDSVTWVIDISLIILKSRNRNLVPQSPCTGVPRLDIGTHRSQRNLPRTAHHRHRP